MWDYETDARLLWPAQQKYPTEAEKRALLGSERGIERLAALWRSQKDRAA